MIREGDRVRVVRCDSVPSLIGRRGVVVDVRHYGGRGGTCYWVALDGDASAGDPFGPGQLRRM